MLKPYEPPEGERDPVPPECTATVERLQRALDGEPADLDADPHALACPACRDRVRAARLLLATLAARELEPVPAGFADRVVLGLQTERRISSRRRILALVGGFATAAAVLVAVWFLANRGERPKVNPPMPDVVQQSPEVAPMPREKAPELAAAPEPRPVRLGDQLAKAGATLRDAPRPLTDSVAAAPKVFDMLTAPLKLPPPDPMANTLEPARKSLVELPIAAQSGLEPVTGVAQKAFNKFLRDVGAVKPNS